MKDIAYNLCVGDCFHIPGNENNLFCEGHFTTASKAVVIIYSFFVNGKREYGVIRSDEEVITI